MRKALPLLLMLVMPVGMALASDDKISASTERLMAVYVYNFTRYTNWPGEAVAGMGTRLAVLGKNPFGSAMDEVAAKSPPESEFQIKYCGGVGCAQGSDTVFIAGENMNASSVQLMLTELYGKPVLTISDMPGFADMGGMIELQHINGKLTFRINLAAASRGNLHISAQLLQLGDVIGVKP